MFLRCLCLPRNSTIWFYAPQHSGAAAKPKVHKMPFSLKKTSSNGLQTDCGMRAQHSFLVIMTLFNLVIRLLEPSSNAIKNTYNATDG